MKQMLYILMHQLRLHAFLRKHAVLHELWAMMLAASLHGYDGMMSYDFFFAPGHGDDLR